MWVLILFIWLPLSNGAVAMHEFSSLEKCQNAGDRAIEMSKDHAGVTFTCNRK